MSTRPLLVAFLAFMLLAGLLSFSIGEASAHQSPDHSDIGVDVTIESAVLLGDGHIRATGQYLCGPEDEEEFGQWGVGFRVFEGADRTEGYAERSGPLTDALCTGEWERWTLESTQIGAGGIRTAGDKVAKAKIQDSLVAGDERTHKHLGGEVLIPVAGGEVDEPNLAPTASYTFSCSGLSCDFDGSASSDADGSIAGYAWDFGDGATATGAVVSHTYAAAGTYTVALTVTDDQGATGTDSKAIPVAGGEVDEPNLAPTASYTFSCSGLSCDFDGSGSSDADGSIAGYAWDFGDGATATGAVVSHTYAAAGTYTVVLTVTDDQGATDTQPQAVSVTEVPWNLMASAYKIRGNRFVDLEWNTAATTAWSVDVYRNDLKIDATANDGAYTDSLGKGGGTATYHLCSSGSTDNCSQKLAVSF